MISLKSNPPERMPDYCIQRHHCLRLSIHRPAFGRAKCTIGCGPWDFAPRHGDAHVRRNIEKAEAR